MKIPRMLRGVLFLVVASFSFFIPTAYAGNEVLGEIQLEGKSKVEKTSGVWLDGQYVGFLKELRGSKKLLLLPGEHTIVIRQSGYQDFKEDVLLHPGERRVVHVVMDKAPTGPLPQLTATVKIAVNPSRAAVFLDGLFVGHVAEFEGLGRGMLVAPGRHEIKIALPGYQTFESHINPLPKQTVEIKTDLLKSSIPLAEPLLKMTSASASNQVRF